jgi:DNA-binding Lrp family transcriptional regulator
MDIVTSTPESELLQALQEALAALEAGAHEPDTITSSEFAEALGLGQNSALRRLKKLLDAGVLEPVMVRRTNAWGVTRQMQGYRYVRE